MSKIPMVSVIIPTYNYAHYICEAIDSVLTSDFPQEEIEIIVVDDGSTDDTLEKVRNYGNKVNYIFQENTGKAWATKTAIDKACGRYVFNLDADDLFLSCKLQKVIEVFEQAVSIVHVGHRSIIWNIDNGTKTIEKIPKEIVGRQISGKELLSILYKRNMLFGGGSTFAARTEVLKRVPIPRAVDMFIDEHLILQTLMHGDSFLLDEPLSIWRAHSKNYSNFENILMAKDNKPKRDIYSRKAVLQSLIDQQFSTEIEDMYRLKLNVAELAIKEKQRQKRLGDIFRLWRFILINFNLFCPDFIHLIRAYTLLNRSLPSGIHGLFKSLKSRYQENYR